MPRSQVLARVGHLASLGTGLKAPPSCPGWPSASPHSHQSLRAAHWSQSSPDVLRERGRPPQEGCQALPAHLCPPGMCSLLLMHRGWLWSGLSTCAHLGPGPPAALYNSQLSSTCPGPVPGRPSCSAAPARMGSSHPFWTPAGTRVRSLIHLYMQWQQWHEWPLSHTARIPRPHVEHKDTTARQGPGPGDQYGTRRPIAICGR